MSKHQTAIDGEFSLAEIFDQAKDAWARVEEARRQIEQLRASIKTWKTELAAAEAKLAMVLGKAPAEEKKIG